MKKYLLCVGVLVLLASVSCDEVIGPDTLCKGVLDGTFLNNDRNCQAFWVCFNETATEGACDSAYNFNEEEQLCDHPTEYKCFDSTTTSTTSTTTTSTTTPMTPPDDEPYNCPSTGIQLTARNGTCTQYNLCFAGFHTVRKCDDGLHFDDELNTCNYPEYADCWREICPSTNNIYNIVTIPSPNNCSEFSICYNGKPTLQSCGPNLHWNQTIQHCVRPSNSECVETTPLVVCPSDELQLFPHPTNCSEFFICSQSVAYPQKCAENLQFDANLLTCNVADVAECAQSDSLIASSDSLMARREFANFFLTSVEDN